MPPVQCPDCGRFLKKAFVASLADAPAPCPACGIELRAEMLDPQVVEPETTEPVSPMQRAEDELHGRGDAADAHGEAATGALDAEVDAGSSVRPPDLVPEEVREGPGEVLSGWDSGVGPELDAWNRDQPPFPTDAAVLAGAGLAGLLIGAAVSRDRRGPAAATGAVAGVVAAAVARRIWRLDV